MCKQMQEARKIDVRRCKALSICTARRQRIFTQFSLPAARACFARGALDESGGAPLLHAAFVLDDREDGTGVGRKRKWQGEAPLLSTRRRTAIDC